MIDINNIKGITKTYKKDDIVFEEGTPCEKIGYVIEGGVKIITDTINYNEYTIANIEKDDVFGEILLFSSNPVYNGTVIANKKTIIKFISKKDILLYIKDNPEDYLNLISDKFINLNNRTKILLQKNIEEKILFYIYSYQKKNNTNIIPIISKEKLASYLNIPRPSLSRTLIELKKKKLIDYDLNYIYIK